MVSLTTAGLTLVLVSLVCHISQKGKLTIHPRQSHAFRLGREILLLLPSLCPFLLIGGTVVVLEEVVITTASTCIEAIHLELYLLHCDVP